MMPAVHRLIRPCLAAWPPTCARADVETFVLAFLLSIVTLGNVGTSPNVAPPGHVASPGTVAAPGNGAAPGDIATPGNVAVVDQAGPVSGTVLDSSGAPVPNATVRLEASGTTVAEFTTGIDGRFELKAVASGDVRIVVTAAGFAQAAERLSDGGRSMQVTLHPAAFFEAVNVTSSRTDVP